MKKVFWDGRWCTLTDTGLVGRRCDPPEADDEVWEAAEHGFQPKGGEKKIQPGEEGIPPPIRPGPGMSEYKVITQRDEFFGSKFNPEKLEEYINIYAADGWRVVSVTATDVGSFWGSFWNKGGGAVRQELVVLLGRTVK
jgi:hypothetical protein